MKQRNTTQPLNAAGLFAFKLAACLIGIAIISMSGAIFYLLAMGSDPYQMLAISLHKKLAISYGQANNLLNGTVILLMVIFKRRYLKLSLFLCLLVSGFFADLFTALLSTTISAELPLPVKLLLALVGCTLLAFGVFLYITPQLGASPADSVGLIISDMTGVSYKLVRIGTDTFYALVGFLLGGPLGLVTILTVLLTGPLIGLFQTMFSSLPLITLLAGDKQI